MLHINPHLKKMLNEQTIQNLMKFSDKWSLLGFHSQVTSFKCSYNWNAYICGGKGGCVWKIVNQLKPSTLLFLNRLADGFYQLWSISQGILTKISTKLLFIIPRWENMVNTITIVLLTGGVLNKYAEYNDHESHSLQSGVSMTYQ